MPRACRRRIAARSKTRSATTRTPCAWPSSATRAAPLETAVAKYNEGLVLAKRCHDLLKQAESVVVKIADGETLQDFPKLRE